MKMYPTRDGPFVNGSWRPDRLGTDACTDVARALQTYVDGELDAAPSSEVSAHLGACRRCGLEADAYAELKRSIRNEVAPPPGAIKRLREFAEGMLADGSTDGAGSHRNPSVPH